MEVLDNMSNKISTKPCPICRKLMFIVGVNSKKEKLTSCGHSFKFKKTKSQKDLDRKYVKTAWGMEIVE
jgi:hypothetical protein